MVNKTKILELVIEKALSEYEHFSSFTNTDVGKRMIILCSKELSCREVNNWGRQESRDYYIGIDEGGWVQYEHTIKFSAGPLEISNVLQKKLIESDVLEYLDSENCTDQEFLSFWSSVNSIYHHK